MGDPGIVGVLAPFLKILATSSLGLCDVRYVPQLSFRRQPGLVNEGSGLGASKALSISSLVYRSGSATPFDF
jgi:hypothetical protein